MAKIAKAIVLSIFFLFSNKASAQIFDDSREIICQTSGYDVIIFNHGSNAIAAGTQLRWSVPFARMQGDHTLDSALEPGQRAFLTGVLGSSFLGSATQCEVALD